MYRLHTPATFKKAFESYPPLCLGRCCREAAELDAALKKQRRK